MCRNCELKQKSYKNDVTTYEAWGALGESFLYMQKEDIAKAVANTDGEENGGEEFLAYELIIASILGLAFFNVGEEGSALMLRELKAGGAHKLDEAIAKAAPVFEQTFAYKDTAEKVQLNLRRALNAGGDLAGSRELLAGVFRVDDVLRDMVVSTKYFTNKYFNEIVAPELQDIVKRIFDNPGISGADIDTAAYKAVREAMEARLKSVPYWRIVANAAASRGFHYGAIKAGIIKGAQGYKLVAVLDEKTSEICRFMNGKEFWVADAEIQVNKAAAADGNDIKIAAPWLSYRTVKDMTNDELRDHGFIVPPFHGHCRTTIQFI